MQLNMGNEMGRAACFVGVGANQPFCQGGALVLTNDGHPAALTFVGARNGLEDLTEAVPIGVVMENIVESLVLRFLDIIA